MRNFGLLCLVLLLVGCRSTTFFVANAPTLFYSVEHRARVPYGTLERQRLDVYSPRQARSRPVVIFWYGGSFVEGSASEYRFVGATLARRGFVAVLADYRLYPQVTFPAFDVDGARAVAWVEQNISKFGGDPHRIILMGHSAGGHLAAFLALNHAFLEKHGADPRSIAGLVGLSGPYVLRPAPGTHYPAFPPPYTESDYQPIRFVDENAPPTLLLHGTDDQEVSPEQATQLRDALLSHHVRVELHLYPHRGHADTVASFAPVEHGLTPAVEDTVAFIESLVPKTATATAGTP